MALKERVACIMYHIECDSCHFAAPEAFTGFDAQLKAGELGFKWGSTDGSMNYRDLCPHCQVALAEKDAAPRGAEEE